MQPIQYVHVLIIIRTVNSYNYVYAKHLFKHGEDSDWQTSCYRQAFELQQWHLGHTAVWLTAHWLSIKMHCGPWRFASSSPLYIAAILRVSFCIRISSWKNLPLHIRTASIDSAPRIYSGYLNKFCLCRTWTVIQAALFGGFWKKLYKCLVILRYICLISCHFPT